MVERRPMSNTVSTTESLYKTLPMRALATLSARRDEEEIFIEFEQATSARFAALQTYLVNASDANVNMDSLPSFYRKTNYRRTKLIAQNLFSTQQLVVQKLQSEHRRMKRFIMLASFGLLCLLAGCDVMALLILHMR